MQKASRPRRNRRSRAIRDLLQESWLRPQQFIWPVFIQAGFKKRDAIDGLDGQFRWSVDLLIKELEVLCKAGLQGLALFPCVPDEKKDRLASYASDPEGFYPEAIAQIKRAFPELVVMTDVAMDPYSSDGHDGLVRDGRILNDETLPILAKMAICQAQAGADWIGPSDMMDHRIGFLREALDEDGYQQVSLISYCAKYASHFYGPFRRALDSAPKEGDKKTYQMNSGNRMEALRELRLDIEEGADLVMVKPALSYLDVILTVTNHSEVPVAAYNVSGEYAMVKAMAEKGLADERDLALEVLISIARAGAQVILSYHTDKALREKWL